MKSIFKGMFGLKGRRYPIQRDSRGKSIRQRCFEMFDESVRPVETARMLGFNKGTVMRYFRQWKQLDPNFDKQYEFVKPMFSSDNPNRASNIEHFALLCDISPDEFEAELSKPNGLKRFITGKLKFPGHDERDIRRNKVLEIAIFLDEFIVITFFINFDRK